MKKTILIMMLLASTSTFAQKSSWGNWWGETAKTEAAEKPWYEVLAETIDSWFGGHTTHNATCRGVRSDGSIYCTRQNPTGAR